MALLTGPMMSLQARGKFGDTIIYSGMKGRSYAKPYKQPTVRRYPAQRSVRAIMRFLTKEWKSNNWIDIPSWDTLAAKENNSAIASYLRFNFNLIWSGGSPSAYYPVSSTFSPGIYSAADVTGNVGSISVSLGWDELSYGWGALVYLVPVSHMPSDRDIALIMCPASYPGLATDTILNVPPGTYDLFERTFGLSDSMSGVSPLAFSVTVS